MSRLIFPALLVLAALPGVATAQPGPGTPYPQAAPYQQGAPNQQRGPRGGGTAMTLPAFQARMRGKMMSLDTNRDGRVSMAEYAARSTRNGGGGRDPARAFAKMDANHDGFLDPREIDGWSAQRFARRDLDRNGVVTPDERAARHGPQARR